MKFFVLVILCGLFSTLAQAAAINPDIEWRTLETDHFELIYDARNHQLAEEYAADAERAHSLIAPLFPKPSKTKTVIVLDDWTDEANGEATPFPRNQISIFPVLPTFLDSISHYDNWSQQILAHEYTHILTMEESNGITAPLRFVFGSIIRPVAVMPSWYLEGFAVEMESRYTHWGRLRSPYFQALTRAFVHDGSWYRDDIAQVNESMDTWPYGLRPYFWGSLLLHEIAEEKGTAELVRLNSRYAGRIPFFINGPVEDLLGVDYAGLLQRVREKYDKGAKRQLAEIEKAGTFQQSPISTESLGHSPQISPDGKKLVYVSSNKDGESELRLIERSSLSAPFSGASKALTTSHKIGRVSWFPDSKTLAYDKLGPDSLYTKFSDIYTIDITNKTEKTITHELRAQEPAVDASGHRILFIQLHSSNSELVLMDADGKNPESLYRSSFEVRLSRPSFYSPTEVIFSERNAMGREFLRLLDLKTKSVRTVLEKFEPALAPEMTSKGLVFISDRTGVSNLYVANHSLTDAQAVTNTPTKILMGTVDPQTSDLYVSQLTSSGAQVVRQSWPTQPVHPPQLESVTESKWTEFQEPARAVSAEDHPYKPMSYLWPQYWMPLFSLVPDGVYLEATTGAADPLGIHAYDLDLNYDSLSEKPGGYFDYNYTHGPIVYSFGAAYQPIYYYALGISAPTYGGYVGAGFPLSTKYTSWSGVLRWDADSTELPGVAPYRQSGPAVGVKFDNTSMKPTSISPESGGQFYVEQQQFLKGLGSLDYGRTRANAAYYFSKWLPEHHAIMLRVNSTWSPDNRGLLLGTSAGGDYSFTFVDPQFTVRGYPVGEFLGWSVATGTFEYRFPLYRVYSGYDTKPFFLKRWHGAVFADVVTLDGGYYDSELRGYVRTTLKNAFYSAGVEARSDLTLAYHVPATLRLGLFYGFTNRAFGGLTPFIGLTLPKF